MKIWFKLGEEDAAKYPEGPQWFAYDTDALYDMRSGDLINLEESMNGMSIVQMEDGFKVKSAAALKAVMFLARKLAGVEERWENFDPFIWKVEWSVMEPDDNKEHPTMETAKSPTG